MLKKMVILLKGYVLVWGENWADREKGRKMKEGKRNAIRDRIKKRGWLELLVYGSSSEWVITCLLGDSEISEWNLFALRVAHAYQERTSASRFARVVCVCALRACVCTCMYMCVRLSAIDNAIMNYIPVFSK